ncbi:MAG: sulfotransferase [Phycisphaeraceae bacterium]
MTNFDTNPTCRIETQFRLPDFLIIGAAKSGTTTLWHLLGQHPEVFLPRVKEPWFFSHHHERGLGWYADLFSEAPAGSICGEASVTYTMRSSYPGVAERIAETLPEAKLIYIVRHPLQQIESMFFQRRKVSGKQVPHEFNRAIHRCSYLIDGACYARQLDPYRRYVDDDRVLLLLLDDLEAKPRETLARTLAFLGVDPEFSPPDDRPRNVSVRHTVDTHTASFLRRLPGFRWVADHTPRSMIRAARSILKQPINERPGWTRETYTRVLTAVRPEAQEVLRRLGRPESTWDLSANSIRLID